MKSKSKLGICTKLLAVALLIGAIAVQGATAFSSRSGSGQAGTDRTPAVDPSPAAVAAGESQTVREDEPLPLPPSAPTLPSPTEEMSAPSTSSPATPDSPDVPDVSDAPCESDVPDVSDVPGESGEPSDGLPTAGEPSGADPTPAPAPSGDHLTHYVTVERESFALSGDPTAAISYDRDALRDDLRKQLQNFEKSVDISKYNVKEEEIDSLLDLIVHGLPECFNVSGGVRYYTASGTITTLMPSYIMSAEEYQTRLAACQKSADAILSGLRGNNELSDVEKALLIHDRLAVWCEYDLSFADAAYRMDGALIDGRAVCQGYALTYGYLLDQVGIRNEYVSSKKLNHAWNLVYIDGVPYHTDVTWDDPTQDITGRVLHDNFLRSTAGIVFTKHTASDYTTAPKDTRYDNAYWQDSQSAFQYLRGGLYYVGYSESSMISALYRRDGEKSTKVADLPTVWNIPNSTSFYQGGYSRLASDGNRLLVSTPDGIYACDGLTGTLTAIWQPTSSAGYKVYGFAYLDGKLICDLFSSPNFESNTKAKYQQKQSYIVTVIGDADGDGTVAPMDLELIQRHLNGLDVEIDQAVCDADGDGRISMRDLVLLRQFLNGMSVNLGKRP